MSRKEKFSRSARGKVNQHVTEASNIYESETEISVSNLPSRRKTHPSSKVKLTKIYYNILFILFVALVVFLFWYGNKYSITP